MDTFKTIILAVAVAGIAAGSPLTPSPAEQPEPTVTVIRGGEVSHSSVATLVPLSAEIATST